MEGLAKKRILAFLTALAIIFGSVVLFPGFSLSGHSVGESSGNVGTSSLPVEEPEEVEETQEHDIALGYSVYADQFIQVGSYAQFKAALTNNSAEEINILLTDNIRMEDYISVPGSKNIKIDGQGHYIDEVKSSLWNLRVSANTTITMVNMDIYGKSIYGIVQGTGSNITANFDNIHYVGPQFIYIEHSKGLVTVKDSTISIKDRGARAEEVFQVPRVEFYGTVFIDHLVGEDVNHIKDATFYLTGGAPHGIHVHDGASVYVESGSYLFHSSTGTASMYIGDNATFDAVACGSMGTGAGMTTQYFQDFYIGENARFSYNQAESTAKPSNGHEQDYGRGMPIRGTFQMEPGSVFIHHTQYTAGVYGRTGGVFIGNANVIFNSPKIFSIYNPAGAFNVIPSSGAVTNWGTTKWTVNGVNTVNLWNDADDAAPLLDRSYNVPDYVWNTYFSSQADGSSQMGVPFDFAVSNSGVISGPSLSENLGKDQVLSGTAIHNAKVKRFVLGTIDPFTVDHISPTDNGVSGLLDGDDVTVLYKSNGEEIVLTGNLMNGQDSYFLPYGEKPRPVGDTPVLAVANMQGLRAVLASESKGALTIESVPVLDYGVNPLPTETTRYFRHDNDTVIDGEMRVVIRDTRGNEAGGWKLTVQRGGLVDEEYNPLPEKSLVFRNGDNEFYIGNNSNVVFEKEQSATDEMVETVVTWARDDGILVEAHPGEMVSGSYREALVWAFEIAP